MQSEILDVEAVGSVSDSRGPRERDALAAALSGEARKVEPRRRPAEKLSPRVDREAVRVPAQFEIARRRIARRRQLEAGDRLPADFGARELRDPGNDFGAPQVGEP